VHRRSHAPQAERLDASGGLDCDKGPAASSNNLLVASIWPDAFNASVAKRTRQFTAYMQMARLQNVLPSFAMVLVGALCASHSWQALKLPAVWAMATASAGIAVSSVIVNDYFDFCQGVDLVNAPDKPLPRCASAMRLPWHFVTLSPQACML
jgi:hypothetical protein